MSEYILPTNYGDDSYEFIKSSAIDMLYNRNKEIIPAISTNIKNRSGVFFIVTQICNNESAPPGTNFLAMQLIDRSQSDTGVKVIVAVSLALKHTSQYSELIVKECIDLTLEVFSQKTTRKIVKETEIAMLLKIDWVITWTPIDALTTWSSILFMNTKTLESVIDQATPILEKNICSGAMSGTQVGLIGAALLIVILMKWHGENESLEEEEDIFSIEETEYEDIRELWNYMKELYDTEDVNKWITKLST